MQNSEEVIQTGQCRSRRVRIRFVKVRETEVCVSWLVWDIKQKWACCRCCLVTAVTAVRFCATLWTLARQAPLSMGFSRQEYWSGLPCPPPGDLPDPGIKLESPALQADSLPMSHEMNEWNEAQEMNGASAKCESGRLKEDHASLRERGKDW